jgi:hypothetical protein
MFFSLQFCSVLFLVFWLDNFGLLKTLFYVDG